ncbi:MAG: FAD-dependent oxidoreductase [Patescibacteria group bacterium]
MQVKSSYEYVVIGAGSGGLTVAIGLAKLKKDVLVVTRDVGGECTHTGCVPSKAFLYHAKRYHEKLSGEAKKELGDTIFTVIQQKVGQITHEDELILTENQVPFVIGTASFLDKHRLSICLGAKEQQMQVNRPGTGQSEEAVRNGEDPSQKSTTVAFKKAIIATGSSPRIIEIPGLPGNQILTNETVFQLKKLPERLVVIGGGPIGAELATAFAKMGTEVSMVIRSTFIPGEPRAVSSVVKSELENLGVTVYEGVKEQTFDTKTRKLVLKNAEGVVVACIPDADYYLMALGRVPNTNSLNLDKAGIVSDTKGIQTNRNLQTSQKHIYAIGDVTQDPKFTHLANNHGRFVVTKQVLPWVQRKQVPLPRITFTDPPIASVGQTRSDEDQFIREFPIDFNQSDRGKIEERSQMFGRIYVHMLSGRIVGASLVGHFTEHVISFFTLAIQKRISLFGMSNLMIPYPTYFQSFGSLSSVFLQTFISELPGNLAQLLRKNIIRIITALFWAVIAGIVVWYLFQIAFDVQVLARTLFELFSSPFGILLFILAYALRALISAPATLLSVLGGAIYGFWGGILLTILASNLSSTVAYLMGRTVFSSAPPGEDKVSVQQESGVKQYVRSNTFEAVLVLRLAAFPYDLLSYIAGGIRAPFLPFILATALGAMPGSIAITSFGASLEHLENLDAFSVDQRYLIFGIVLMIVSILVSQIIKRLRPRAASKKQK